MSLCVRGLFRQVGIGSFLEFMHFHILLEFLFLGSFGELKWGVFMWGFDFGWLCNLENWTIDRKEFDVICVHLASHFIFWTADMILALPIVHDPPFNTQLTKRMTAHSKDPGKPFLGIVDTAKGTWELSLHDETNVLIILGTILGTLEVLIIKSISWTTSIYLIFESINLQINKLQKSFGLLYWSKFYVFCFWSEAQKVLFYGNIYF